MWGGVVVDGVEGADSVKESNDELDLRPCGRENRLDSTNEGRRDMGDGEGARDGSESSVLSPFLLRLIFLKEPKTLEALAFRPFGCFAVDSGRARESLL